MSKLYSIRIVDDSGNTLAVLEDSTNETYHLRRNEATGLSFSYPASGEKAQLLTIAERFEIWRKDKRVTAGKITKRDMTGDPWKISGLTPEIYLEGLITPSSVEINGGPSVLGASADLADLVEALTYDYESQVINRNFDTGHVAAITDADISFELTDRIVLAKDGNNTYPAVNAGDAKGRVGFQFSITVGYELFRLRWAQEVAETNEIICRYRTSTDGGSTWTAWSAWTGQNAQEDTPGREGYPLSHPAGTDTVQVQFQLLNSDTTTETEGYDAGGIPITIYGSTPVLDAVELVCRQADAQRTITPDATDWPAGATVTVYDIAFDRETALAAINTICTENDYEFWVDGDLKLHLGNSLGTDRSNEVVFRHGHNTNITQLTEDSDKIGNIAICLGAGDGINQLHTVLRDQQSIDDHGPRPFKFQRKEITDLATLQTKGQAALDQRKNPTTKFKVKVDIQDLPDFDLGDTVRIVIPSQKINVTGVVKTIQGHDRGMLEIGINDYLDSIINKVNQVSEDVPEKKPQEATKPPAPVNFRATAGYGRVTLRWDASGLVRIYVADAQVGPYKRLWQGTGNAYTHEPVANDVPKYYRATRIVDGVESDPAGPVRATPTPMGRDALQADMFDITATSYNPDTGATVAPSSGSLRNLWDQDTSTGVTFAAGPVAIEYEFPMMWFFDLARLWTAAALAYYVEVKDEDTGTWSKMTTEGAANPTSTASDWTVRRFDNGVMKATRHVRVIFPTTGAVDVREIKAWTITFADEILAQVLNLTGQMQISNDAGNITITPTSITITSTDGKTTFTGDRWEVRDSNNYLRVVIGQLP